MCKQKGPRGYDPTRQDQLEKVNSFFRKTTRDILSKKEHDK